jgi:hypothetical protein
MTEDEIKARGYPGGDKQLLERYIAAFGGPPELAFGLAPSSEWGREILYNALAMEAAAGKSVRTGPIGAWTKDELKERERARAKQGTRGTGRRRKR